MPEFFVRRLNRQAAWNLTGYFTDRERGNQLDDHSYLILGTFSTQYWHMIIFYPHIKHSYFGIYTTLFAGVNAESSSTRTSETIPL